MSPLSPAAAQFADKHKLDDKPIAFIFDMYNKTKTRRKGFLRKYINSKRPSFDISHNNICEMKIVLHSPLKKLTVTVSEKKPSFGGMAPRKTYPFRYIDCPFEYSNGDTVCTVKTNHNQQQWWVIDDLVEKFADFLGPNTSVIFRSSGEWRFHDEDEAICDSLLEAGATFKELHGGKHIEPDLDFLRHLVQNVATFEVQKIELSIRESRDLLVLWKDSGKAKKLEFIIEEEVTLPSLLNELPGVSINDGVAHMERFDGVKARITLERFDPKDANDQSLLLKLSCV